MMRKMLIFGVMLLLALTLMGADSDQVARDNACTALLIVGGLLFFFGLAIGQGRGDY